LAIHIYTDGGCSGNPGPGGWAFVIVDEAADTAPGAAANAVVLSEKWGGEQSTTNNRMELLAVIKALETLPAQEAVEGITVITDSQYVQKGISLWIKTWKKNGWKTASRQSVKNAGLWQRLDALAAGRPIAWQWVKGHAGNPFNERCDTNVQRAIAATLSS
jgi:ribonuclease HI